MANVWFSGRINVDKVKAEPNLRMRYVEDAAGAIFAKIMSKIDPNFPLPEIFVAKATQIERSLPFDIWFDLKDESIDQFVHLVQALWGETKNRQHIAAIDLMVDGRPPVHFGY